MQQSKKVKLKILFMGIACCLDSAGPGGNAKRAYIRKIADESVAIKKKHLASPSEQLVLSEGVACVCYNELIAFESTNA